MYSGKSLSPQKLSAYTALALSIPITLGIFIFKPVWWIALLSFIAICAGSYGLILFTLQRFIYRKLKLIYKLIYHTKATKREELYYKSILPQKGIDEVREDVENWARQRTAEVEVLRQNEKFRREFLQNLSHELKTPVFAIQGYVDTLIGGAINNEAVNMRFLQNASKNVDRLVNLLDDLDEISRIESGQFILNKQQFVIQELIKEVYDSLELKAREKKISLRIKKGCEEPFNVYADKERIRQVFMNLIDNSIKYGREHGFVEASFYNVDGSNILVEIGDNGYGMEEEHLKRIFERFYRTDLARSRKEGGSGLGLSICKHIIEAHGQAIHVRSKPDVGSTFGFSLPSRKSISA